MNKKLKSISCILAATCTFLVAENTMKVGPLAVDVVSAATGEAPAPAPSKPATTTKTTSTTSYTTGKATRLLAIGSVGDDVKLVQTNLNEKGYKLTADGIYGKLTANAVKEFQKAVGLIVDGIVGPNTLGVLIPSTAVPTSIVNVGSVGSDVKYLQSNLNKLGYKLSVDGIFGNQTSEAVKDFQKANGLSVDGIAGPKTFGKLFEKVSAPAAPAAPTTPTTPTTPVPPTTPPVDTVTSASQVNDAATFEKNIADPNSNYMQIVNKDLTFTKDLTVVSGTKPGTNGAASTPNRSIAPAAENLATKVITARYTITVPNLVLSGQNEKVEYGTIKGNVYVQNTGFTLKDAKIDGNLYFATQALMDAFVKDATTTITGQTAVKAYTPAVDVVASASQVNDEANFVQKISSANSEYMMIVTKDLTFSNDLIVQSGIRPGTNGAASTPNRSIAPADENLTTKTITKRYTITVPNLVFSGQNEKVEYGIIKGDVYVQNTGFTLKDATINGNLYFATQALMDAFVKDATTVITGQTAVKAYTPVDAVTGATQVSDEVTFAQKITNSNSEYMIIVTKDLTFSNDLVVESGIRPGANGAAPTPNRSIAPADENLTTKVINKRYTISVPNLVFSGLNEKVEYGIIKGDVYVQNTGFTLKDATINGNLYFATQALMDAFTKDATTTITGQIAVKAYK